MVQRRSRSEYTRMEPTVAAPAAWQPRSRAGLRLRFYMGLLTFLVGLTGFLLVLTVAMIGS